jgi:hypothetical protein
MHPPWRRILPYQNGKHIPGAADRKVEAGGAVPFDLPGARDESQTSGLTGPHQQG